MEIFYGILGNNIEVTSICLSTLTSDNIITIPAGDLNRASHFTDPLVGVLKIIIISNNNKITTYNDLYTIKINLLTNAIDTINDNDSINSKLAIIQSSLKINYGGFNEELPEQKMVVKYLKGHEKVLEIGGNIGRNSLVIASILGNNSFLTLESDVNIANQLTENRNLNNFNFHIECAALSNRKLIQHGWNTIPSDILQTGYNWVNIISLNELKVKYNIDFNTLVLDCEGAFYYILMDMPEILDNINLIIMENDYHDISHKNYIDEILTSNKFRVDYVEGGGWGPCENNFFEVWIK